MNYSFTIREATADDAAAIRNLINASFKKYRDDNRLPDNIDALNETDSDIAKDIFEKEVFVALIDNIPVGTIRIEILNDKTAYISRFGVSPEYHNIGIGKALINLVDKFNISKGVLEVKLHTASKDKDLVRFYYGRGFYVESTSTDRGYVRALMVKKY